jgi:hypothetical protein
VIGKLNGKEQGPADERDEREPLDEIDDAVERRPAEQLREHGPQLREQQGNARDSRCDVYALRDPVQARRPTRKREPGRRMLGEM